MGSVNGRAKYECLPLVNRRSASTLTFGLPRSGGILLACLLSLFSVQDRALSGEPPDTRFQPLAGDVASYDPRVPIATASDKTIKLGLFWPFSGPLAINGELALACIGWVVHDINSQGGITIDGHLREIQIIKGDHQGKPTTAKRVMERLCLEHDVDIVMGTSGTHLNLIGQQVAAKYKKIYVNVAALSDMLMDEQNFNRYTFRICATTTMLAKALANYYLERPEDRFYILCQDYVYGHAFGTAFKNTLLARKPTARIIGEDYHRLGATDFAPYLEKVRGYGTEVIVTGDWPPDIDNLIKQSRQLGMTIPISGPFVSQPNPLRAIGGPAGVGFVAVEWFAVTNPAASELVTAWNKRWQAWDTPPHNTPMFKWPGSILGSYIYSAYWLFDLMATLGTTDPEQIIPAFEKSEFTLFGHTMKMRASDHQAIMDLFGSPLEYPNRWFDDLAAADTEYTITAEALNQPDPVRERTEEHAIEETRSTPVSMYVSQMIHGLTYGMLLFLVASGLTLVFGMMGVLNIAHASFFMLAGYLCYQVLGATGNFWLSLLLAPIGVGLLGVAMQRFLLRRVQAHGLGHVGELLLTLGVALVIAETVKVFWGTDSLVVAIPASLSGLITVGGLQYPIYRLFIVGLASILLCLLGFILMKTKLGAIVRAAVSDSEMVSALGINMPRVSMLVFGIGAWMAGIAGVAAAPLLTVFPGMAEQMSLDAFVVVVVGGLGSLSGAFIVSLVLGELNAFGIQFIPRLAPVLVFAFMALVLSLRPMGFFGERK